MNKIQYLLCKLSGECAEVSQIASKGMIFGLHADGSPTGKTNHTLLIDEYTDLVVIVEMLREEGVSLPVVRDAIDAKKEKVNRYLNYSIQLGCVQA